MSEQKNSFQLNENNQEAIDYLFQDLLPNKTPITALGGELQTGKTTTGINIKQALLESGEQPGVVANDIDTGVDAARYDLPSELTEDIENICIGCGGIGELTDAITQNEELVNSSDHVLVEPTGKADPEEVLDNLYHLEDTQDNVEVENMLYVLSLEDFQEGTAQSLSRVQKGVEAANAVIYSFPEKVDYNVLREADEWVEHTSENTATYLIDDIEATEIWGEIRRETSKPKRPEKEPEEASSTRIDMYSTDLGVPGMNAKGHENDHQHQGTETVMPVSIDLEETEFIGKLESIIGNLPEQEENGVYLKGFTPNGNAWNYNHGTGEIEVFEVEQGKTPCVTNPGEEAGEEFYQQLRQQGIIPEKEPAFTPGTSKEQVQKTLQKEREKAEEETVQSQLEERGQIAEDFEATETYMEDASEAYQIWQDEQLLQPAKQQYLNTANEAYNNLKQDNLSSAEDEITLAVQAGKILSHPQEQTEKLAGIDEEQYQAIENQFYSVINNFGEKHAQELSDRDDEEDYHEWFAGLIKETENPGKAANSIAQAYDEANLTAAQPYEPSQTKQKPKQV